MKMVVAIIQPHKLDAVREALQLLGIAGVTVTDVQGYGRQRGHTEVYRGHEYTVNFVRKAKLEVACEDNMAEKVLATIAAAAKHADGKIGDGKIFMQELEEVIRIRTGERGSGALQ